MRLGLAAFTHEGKRLIQRLQENRAAEKYGDTVVVFDKDTMSARQWVNEAFFSCDALVFVGATGIAVRLVAEHLVSKDKDPAVVVIDERGRFVIPLLSGHIGGANRLAEELACFLGATAIITTATDIQGVFAVDVWSGAQGCVIADVGVIKHVSSRLLEGKKVGFMSDFPVVGALPSGMIAVTGREGDIFDKAFPHKADTLSFCASESASVMGYAVPAPDCAAPAPDCATLAPDCATLAPDCAALAYAPKSEQVAARNHEPEGRGNEQAVHGDCLPVGVLVSLNIGKQPFPITLHVVPKIVLVGAGCRKGVSPEIFEAFVLDELGKCGISPSALKTLATIDLKKGEECFLNFSAKYSLDFITFSAAVLNGIPGKFSPSSFVRGVTGVDNVCERAAMAAGGERLLLSKTVKDGMTLALAVPWWECHFPW